MPRHPTGAGRYPLDRKTVLLDEAQLERQREYTRQLAALHQQRGKPVYALVDTFGCQQNVADSQHILGMLRDMGCQFTDDAAQADIVVLNTCAIRDHAEKRVYGNLGALTHTKKQNPEQVICLCGCMAQRPEVAEKVRQSYRHVDLVFGPQALWKFPELLYRVYTRRGRVFSVEDEHGTIAEGMPVVREGNVRAWVSIMYGCNNFCSYCIVPYVQVWSRESELSARDRSLITVTALMAQGLTDTSFGHHLAMAKENGITRSEIAEILTHAAFYAGWPKAWAAFRMAKDIWADEESTDEKQRHQNSMIFPIGAPNDGFAQYFSGQSYLAPLSTEQVKIFNVTFEPGCRNNWHIHEADKGGGQILICVAGRGYYQEWGKEPQELHPGDVVNIMPGVKHWHGAAPDSWFSHLAVEVPGENCRSQWCEPVSEEEYQKLK